MDNKELYLHPQPLSGKFIESFAYKIIKDHLPMILTKVIDYVYRKRKSLVMMGIVSDNNETLAEEETKHVIGRLANLRYDLQTDKPIVEIQTVSDDAILWNDYLNDYRKTYGKEPLWFDASWIYVECYMYRRIKEAFELSRYLQSYDPFDEQKRESLKTSLNTIIKLSDYLNSLTQRRDYSVETEFIQFLELSLWGNKCDLSYSCGKQITDLQSSDFCNENTELRKMIVVNDTHNLWNYISKLSSSKSPLNIAVVLDNAGYELFTDLCLIEYLHISGLINDNTIVKFYVKVMPWFVSDTMKKDFLWTLEYLSNNTQSEILSQLSNKWSDNLHTGKWIIVEDKFWTLPYDYSEMKRVAPDLYKSLEESHLILFKGDLNYRKIIGDLSWDVKLPFSTALRGFLPSALCTIRTNKADVIVGIEDKDILERIKNNELPYDWMISNEFAVIQFIQK